MTISAGRIDPLLRAVGVTRIRSSFSPPGRFPSIAATNPRSWSMRPYRTISSLYLRSVGITTFEGDEKKQGDTDNSHTISTPAPETIQNLDEIALVHARNNAPIGHTPYNRPQCLSLNLTTI